MTKLNESEILDIAYSKLTYRSISEKYNIGKSRIYNIKKQHNSCLGKGNNTVRERKLTTDDIKYIIESPETEKVIAEKLNVSKRTVSNERRKAGIKIGSGRKPGGKTTPEQIEIILKSKLNSKDLSEEIGVSYNAIIKIRRKHGLNKPSHSREKKVFSENDMLLVKNLSLSSHTVGNMTGIGYGVIYRKRAELGLNFKEFRKLMPKVKKERPKVVKEKKELPLKIVKPKEMTTKIKGTPAAMSAFEWEQQQKEKARKAKESYAEMEKRQFELGYRWVEVTNQYGKKSMVFKRPYHLIVF